MFIGPFGLSPVPFYFRPGDQLLGRLSRPCYAGNLQFPALMLPSARPWAVQGTGHGLVLVPPPHSSLFHSVGAWALNPPLSHNANGAACRWVLVHSIPADIPPTRPHSSARCEAPLAHGSCHQTPAVNTQTNPNSVVQGTRLHGVPPHNGLPPPARRLHQGKMARFTGARLPRLGVPLPRHP